MPELTEILTGCQNPDAQIRTQAEQALKEAEKSNYNQFAIALATELNNEQIPPHVRQLAGITFKNLLVAKEDSLQQAKHDAWKQLAEETRGQIKSTLLKTLLSPETTARHTAAQACAEVAAVELPFQAWNEFLPTIVDYITNNTHPDVVKISSLECLGFTCERIASLEDESIPEITPAVTDKMLTAIVDGMQETRADSIRLSATIALKNSLLFTKKNMESIDERNIIMQAICQATQSKDVKVRASSFECLVQIAYQYYDKLSDYMNALFQLTTKAIEMDEEEVALNAIEFWSTICEEEMDILDEIADGINDRQCMKYVEGALPNLGPLLTNTLTKQDEDSAGDEDIWNLSMSAATCIGLIANTTEDKVVPVITPFVQQHIQSQDWRFREAAVMAFGSILEGPSSEIIGPFVNQSIPILLGALSDSHAMVKDTAAWTIGRICELHVRAIPTDTFPTLLTSLMEKLQQESPQVAGQAAYALHNLAAAFQMEDASDTNALSQYMSTLLGELLKATERSDADEGNLRPSAFEAISVLIQSAAEDCTPILVSLLPALVTKLQQSFNISVLTGADKERKEAIQGLLCGLIQALIYKLDLSDVEPHADSIMTCFLQVLQIQNATCHQEAFTATSALCDKMEIKFNKYMDALVPFLIAGLQNYEAFQVCTIIVGLLGDICRSIENDVTKYCSDIMTSLVRLLQDNHLHRSVKPPVLSCFGDIAMAIGPQFEPFLPMCLFMLSSAGSMQIPQDDEDLIEYLQTLREAILEGYTGIIQGLRDGGRIDLMKPENIGNIISLLTTIADESDKDEEVVNKALGLLGDLASALGQHAKPYLQRPFVNILLSEANKSQDQSTIDTCRWATAEIQSALQ